MRRRANPNDPLWYKDAVIYELPVTSFYDANGDGVGDFQGLCEKLDYLQQLGVTCLWLLPFFPSPLKDDGYDIADYTSVHPRYGTLEEFRDVRARRARPRHARRYRAGPESHVRPAPVVPAGAAAPPGSPERDYYVWSDTDQKIQGRPDHASGDRALQLDVGSRC